MENPVGQDVLPEDPETRALYRQHWQSIRTEEATGNRIQERYNFTLHEITASTFPEIVRYLYRQQTTALLLVSSSVVSAWPLVSRGGHDGVLGCPVCWNTDRILHRSSCSCGPLHVSFCCQLGWTLCRIPHRNRSVKNLHGYHQPVRSQEKWSSQKAGYKKKQPITTIVITDFSYISPWLIPSSFFPNSSVTCFFLVHDVIKHFPVLFSRTFSYHNVWNIGY
jgi:hypothetical protein